MVKAREARRRPWAGRIVRGWAGNPRAEAVIGHRGRGVGAAVAFLSMNGAKLITGETLYIDGGYYIID